jgi:hypothetical protein
MPLPGRTVSPRPGSAPPRPRSARLSLSALELLSQAHRTLVEAVEQTCPPDRYAAAHLAALRGAAAVLAARSEPPGAMIRRRPTSAWVLLRSMAPELAEWATFFAAGARKRAAAEAGSPQAVSARDADDLVREVDTFLAVVETTLGLPSRPVLGVVAQAG